MSRGTKGGQGRALFRNKPGVCLKRQTNYRRKISKRKKKLPVAQGGPKRTVIRKRRKPTLLQWSEQKGSSGKKGPGPTSKKEKGKDGRDPSSKQKKRTYRQAGSRQTTLKPEAQSKKDSGASLPRKQERMVSMTSPMKNRGGTRQSLIYRKN